MIRRQGFERAMLAPHAREKRHQDEQAETLRPGDRVSRAAMDGVLIVASDPFEFDGQMMVYLKRGRGQGLENFAGCADIRTLTKIKE